MRTGLADKLRFCFRPHIGHSSAQPPLAKADAELLKQNTMIFSKAPTLNQSEIYISILYNCMVYGMKEATPLALNRSLNMSTIATSAVAVFTSWKKDDILARGASGNWGVSPDRILQNRYVVVTRNRHSDWAPDDVEHGTAFLVGRISGVLETDETTADGRSRFAISFDSYAEVRIPGVWGKSRNPVWFTSLETLGIDLNNLNFIDLKTGEKADKAVVPCMSVEGLSFAEARRGLAARYGVSPNSITISING